MELIEIEIEPYVCGLQLSIKYLSLNQCSVPHTTYPSTNAIVMPHRWKCVQSHMSYIDLISCRIEYEVTVGQERTVFDITDLGCDYGQRDSFACVQLVMFLDGKTPNADSCSQTSSTIFL